MQVQLYINTPPRDVASMHDTSHMKVDSTSLCFPKSLPRVPALIKTVAVVCCFSLGFEPARVRDSFVPNCLYFRVLSHQSRHVRSHESALFKFHLFSQHRRNVSCREKSTLASFDQDLILFSSEPHANKWITGSVDVIIKCVVLTSLLDSFAHPIICATASEEGLLHKKKTSSHPLHLINCDSSRSTDAPADHCRKAEREPLQSPLCVTNSTYLQPSVKGKRKTSLKRIPTTQPVKNNCVTHANVRLTRADCRPGSVRFPNSPCVSLSTKEVSP